MRWARGGPRGPSAFIPVEEVSLEGVRNCWSLGRRDMEHWAGEEGLFLSLEIAVLKLSLQVPDSFNVQNSSRKQASSPHFAGKKQAQRDKVVITQLGNQQTFDPQNKAYFSSRR